MYGLDQMIADALDTVRELGLVNVVVTYTRAGVTTPAVIDAVKSHISTEQQLGIFVPTNYEVDDFLFPRTDLVLDGTEVLPVVGDTLTDAAGNVFQVHPLLDDNHYRFSDLGQTILRVHTKQTTRV